MLIDVIKLKYFNKLCDQLKYIYIYIKKKV